MEDFDVCVRGAGIVGKSLALTLARQGLLVEARAALVGLRTQNRRYRKPLLQGWVHYVDGLIDHFDSMSRGARDKFASARAQAALARNQRLQGLSSAWIANCDFNLRRYDDMHDALLLALGCANADDHGTLARAIDAPARSFDVARFCGDPARAHALLGWSPRIPLRDGLALLLEAVRAEQAGAA